MGLYIADRHGKGYVREGPHLVEWDRGKSQSCYFIGEVHDMF